MKIAHNNLRKIIREELSILVESPLEPDLIDVLSSIQDGSSSYLRTGNASRSVALIQSYLKSQGYDLGTFGPAGDGVDGRFGRQTRVAVEQLQSQLGVDDDGIIGPETASAILGSPFLIPASDPEPIDADVVPRIPVEEPGAVDPVTTPASSGNCPPSRPGRSNVYGAPGGGSFVYQLQQFDPSVNNWRSSQPTEEQLRWLIATHGIEHVIRLNGNEGKLTMEREKQICDELGVMYNNGAEGYVDSHAGFVSGQGYLGTIQNVLPMLTAGDCLIHCRAGADRTGYLVAAYLKSEGICTDLEELWDYTTSYNHWGGRRGHICSGGNTGYIRYLEGFYPFDEWCAAKSWRRECTNCGRR